MRRRCTGPIGVKIVRVFGEGFTGKDGCVALLKSQPEAPEIEVEVQMPPVSKTWPVGEPVSVRIARAKDGLGLKLAERSGGDVYVTRTTPGSSAEQALGSTSSLGSSGLRVISVFGQEFEGKAGCVNLLKSSPELAHVDMQFVVDDTDLD